MSEAAAALRGARVVIVIRSFELGGAERQAVMLARFLRHHVGAEVLVWSFSPGLTVPKLLAADGIACHVQSPGSGGGLWHRTASLLGFVRALRRRRPDLLVPFTDLPNKVCGAVWRLTDAAGCLWNQRDEGREVTGRPLERLALRSASAFVANSAVGRAFLTERFGIAPDRVTIVPNGVRLEPAQSSPAAWRERLGLGPDQVVATMIANLHRFKDHTTLLRAWQRVVNELEPLPVLLLAGQPGATADELGGLARELGLERSVRFLGRVDDVAGLLAASDLAVFSSRREGCPNGILEPMAAGLATVATDIVGSREALGDDYPLLVPELDPEAFAAAVLRLAADAGLRARLGQRNRSRAERLFTPETACAAILPVLARALGRG